MKKGTNPSVILESMTDLFQEGSIDPNDEEFRKQVEKHYNKTFATTSKSTVLSNLREEFVIVHQYQKKIIRLPQDTNKLDFMAVEIKNNIIYITLVQQKGNNASFNSSSLKETLRKMTEFVSTNKVEMYFDLLPDDYNPLICKLPYKVEVIVGMVNAIGECEKQYNNKAIKFYANDQYLSKLGLDKTIVDMDMWVMDQPKYKDHQYNAVDNVKDFDTIYSECLTKIKTKYGFK